MDGDAVWVTGMGRRTGFGGSLLSSVGFFTGLFLLSGTLTSALAWTSGSGLAGEMILDSVFGHFNPLPHVRLDGLSSTGLGLDGRAVQWDEGLWR